MKKLWKRIAAAGMAMALAAGLSACDLGGAGMSKKDASYFVQGTMDQAYLGKYDKDWLEFMETTENDAQEAYQERLDNETDFFLYYFDIDTDLDGNEIEVPEEIVTQVRDLYKEIYGKTKYTIEAATKADDGSYNVPVKVQPLNVIKNMEEGYDAYLEQFVPTYTDAELQAMSEADYNAFVESATDFYNNQFAQKMVDYLKEQVAKMDYLEEKSMVVQVKSTTEGDTTTWFLEDDDMAKFDEYLIYYPNYSNYTA